MTNTALPRPCRLIRVRSAGSFPAMKAVPAITASASATPLMNVRSVWANRGARNSSALKRKLRATNLRRFIKKQDREKSLTREIKLKCVAPLGLGICLYFTQAFRLGLNNYAPLALDCG